MCVLAYLEEEDGSWRAGNNKTVLFLVPVREIGLRVSFCLFSAGQGAPQERYRLDLLLSLAGIFWKG